MSNIDPKVLEHAKKIYGEDCELVKHTEWSYTFKCGEKSFCMISRFLVEENLQVDASELRNRWPEMNDEERWDFTANFSAKGDCTDNDTEILEILMNDGDEVIWSTCALALLKHPDRNRVVELLIERVKQCNGKHVLNYIQALGEAKDKRATPIILPYYVKYRTAMEQEATTGIPDDVFFGPIPYHAFLAVAGDLYRIEGSQEYELAIRKYLDHPNEQVRWWAEHALGVDGPITAKRNAEYQKKQSAKGE